MKNLLKICCLVYTFSLISCASVNMTEQEKTYQNKSYQENLDKMAGKSINCKQNFTNNNNVIYKDGHKAPNFSYITPNGEPCLP